MKIFDFHVHPSYNFYKPAPNPQKFREGLEKYGITRCSGSAICQEMYNRPIEEYPAHLERMNREAFAMQQALPDFFVAGIHVHPSFVDWSCEQIEQYAKKGVRLIGELVPSSSAWESYAPKNLAPIMALAAEYGMIVSTHPKRPPMMEEFVRLCPKDLKIVFAHLDGYGYFENEIELMRRYDNVFCDISYHGADRQGMLREALDLVGKDRILYGSDYPGYDSDEILRVVLADDITEDEQEAVLYRNAERLLRLD